MHEPQQEPVHLRVSVMLSGALEQLLEDVDDTPEWTEGAVETLLDMTAGTVLPAVEAAGITAAETATSLVAAIGDRFLADLQAALEIARAEQG